MTVKNMKLITFNTIGESKKPIMKLFALIIAGVCLGLVDYVAGHGMMLDPPGRSSRWRYDPTAETNYGDNEGFCGGFNVQFNVNGGKCGLCGDNYTDATPRANELGGTYGGKGVIVKTYPGSSTIDIGFNITTNHLGHISYTLCNLDEDKTESEECFAKNILKFEDGSDKFDLGTKRDHIVTKVTLPAGLKCEHCVLRWTYTAGNNWGICENGVGKLGCGNQETFKSCADIKIQA